VARSDRRSGAIVITSRMSLRRKLIRDIKDTRTLRRGSGAGQLIARIDSEQEASAPCPTWRGVLPSASGFEVACFDDLKHYGPDLTVGTRTKISRK